MNIYITILIVLFIIKYILDAMPRLTEKEAQTIFLIIASVILALLTGFRDQYTGSDTQNYIDHFLRYRKYSTFQEILSLKVKNDEYGYALWAWIVGRFTDNVNIYFTITAGFFAYSLARFIYKNSSNFFFSIILYYTVGMFGFQLTGMRQAMAMAILLFSIEFIKERKLTKFLLIVWVATWFHRSALAFIFAYPFSKIKINFKNMIFSAMIMISVIVLHQPITKMANEFLGYKFESYSGFTMGGITVICMYALSLILGYIFNKHLHKDNKYNAIFYNVTLYSLAIYVLRYFIQIAERVSFYYHFAFIILLPNIIEAIPDEKTRKVVYISAVTLACSLFYYRYQLRPMMLLGFF